MCESHKFHYQVISGNNDSLPALSSLFVAYAKHIMQTTVASGKDAIIKIGANFPRLIPSLYGKQDVTETKKICSNNMANTCVHTLYTVQCTPYTTRLIYIDI